MTLRHHTLVVGLIIAAAATFGLYRVLEAPKAQKRIVTRPVVIAHSDIQKGRPIEATNIAVAKWPFSTIPLGAHSTVDSLIGRVARVNIFKGEVIVPRHLAEIPAHQEPPRQPPLTNY